MLVGPPGSHTPRNPRPGAGPRRKRGLRLVVTTNLNANLTRAKLLPLLAIPEVTAIHWVTDTPGPALPRVHYVLPRPHLPKGLLRLALRVPVLAWTILRTHPDLVMGFNMNPHGVIVFVLGRLLGCRVCINLIGGPDEIRDGGCRIDPWVPHPSPRLEAFYLAILRRTDVLILVGSAGARYLVAQGIDPARIHLISSKIDPARFRPLSALPRDYDLIIAAGLIPRKRVDLFLRIVAALRPDFPHIRAAILGDGHLQPELEQLAARLGIADHVDFLGFREATEVYFNRAKVFVLTSTTEGLSLAMMEAMACGLPVVVPHVGDLDDIVKDGVTGYLVPSAEPDAFAGAIARLLRDDALREQMSRQARAAVLAGYTIEAGARSWRAVLAGLSRPAPPRG